MSDLYSHCNCVCLFYCLTHIFLKLELYGRLICIQFVFAFAYFIVWGIFFWSWKYMVVRFVFTLYLPLPTLFSEAYFLQRAELNTFLSHTWLNIFLNIISYFSDTRAELSLNTEIYVKPGSALSLECRYTTHCRHILITKSGWDERGTMHYRLRLIESGH